MRQADWISASRPTNADRPDRRSFMMGASLAATALAMTGGRSAAAQPAGDAEIRAAVEDAHRRFTSLTEGKNADYIPYLASVPSNLFGIVAVSPSGMMYQAGDIDYAFAIESISKLFVLAMVMEETGPAELRKKIGADPTGMPFNSVQAIELHQGRPLNPFVNAGAIATTSLLRADGAQQRWSRIAEGFKAFAGHELRVNEDVYKSEAATNQHNRGIAWLLQSYGYMYSDPMEATDIYTRQCSIAVTVKDLAIMGAVLAGGGVHPVSKQRIVAAANVPHLLAEMTLNGMYDASGTWLYEVGLPAKSGVGGGVLSIVPGKLAIAAFSPPLDTFGNSVRAQRGIGHVAKTLKMSLFA